MREVHAAPLDVHEGLRFEVEASSSFLCEVHLEDQRKTVANIVAALWEEQLAARHRGGVDPLLPAIPPVHEDFKAEVEQLSRTLDVMEGRVRVLRQSLEDLD